MKKELLYEKFTVRSRPALNYIEDESNEFKFSPPISNHPEVYLHSLNNAYVSPYGMVFKNGFIVDESLYDLNRNPLNVFSFYKKIIQGNVKTTDKECVVIHNSWYENYYHWCLEALPRLFAVKDRIARINLVLPANLKTFHHQTLVFFDIDSIIECADNELIRCASLSFSSFTAKGFGEHNP